MSRVKNENFITIQGFMVSELKLKGNELIIYAIIYGFSQTDGQLFTGSLQYLADWTNSTKRGVMKNLSSLVEKGYIGKNEKFINGVKFCEYYVTKFTGVVNKVLQGSEQSSPGGTEQSSPNNIYINNIKNNINNNIDTKHSYGEFNNVKLREKELQTLKETYGEDLTNKAITFLDAYIEEKGYKSKSHNLAIRRWVIDAVKEKENKGNGTRKPIRKEIVPSWFDKEYKAEPMSPEEQAKIDELFKEVLGDDWKTEAEKLQEELKAKY